jgi:hypothetical protein
MRPSASYLSTDPTTTPKIEEKGMHVSEADVRRNAYLHEAVKQSSHSSWTCVGEIHCGGQRIKPLQTLFRSYESSACLMGGQQNIGQQAEAARPSTNHSGPAAYYCSSAKGSSYQAPVRALAYKRIFILYRCWQTGHDTTKASI